MTLNSEAFEAAYREAGNSCKSCLGGAACNGFECRIAFEKALRSYLSAIPPVDGLEVAANLPYRLLYAGATLKGDLGQTLMDAAEALSQASSVIAGVKEANEALMRERASLIETKREQISSIQAIAAAMQKRATTWMRACMEAREGCNQRSEVIRKWIAKGEAAEARISSLEEENKRLQRKSDLLETTVSFVRRWAVEKEGNGTSAEERLSAIANHPGVKFFKVEDHNGWQGEADATHDR